MASMRRTIARAIKRDSASWLKGFKYGDNRKTRRAKKHRKNSVK